MGAITCVKRYRIMLTKIWERYFLFEFIKVFSLFLSCFYGLYILIDYASHTNAVPNFQIQIHGNHFIRYYFYVFASRLEILIPIALMIATIKTVSRLNTDRELVALMSSGQALQTLLRPFIQAAFFCMILVYLNEQFILPNALRKLRRIEDVTRQKKNQSLTNAAARHLVLENNSLLIFQAYDASKKHFFDAYWIESINHIYRIKYLEPFTDTSPVGRYVDKIVRQPNGELIQQASYPEYIFSDMRFNKEVLQSTIIEPDVLPIYQLVKEVIGLNHEMTEKESKLLTAFYWKLSMPLLCLIAVLLPLPFCVRFSRNFHVFFIYIGGLFGLIAFYLYLDAIQVVANRQIAPPLWAIFFPTVLFVSWTGWRYLRS